MTEYKGYTIDYIGVNAFISGKGMFACPAPKMEGMTLEQCAKTYIDRIEERGA